METRSAFVCSNPTERSFDDRSDKQSSFNKNLEWYFSHMWVHISNSSYAKVW